MRTFAYNEIGENNEPIIKTFTEEEILKTYYPWWKSELESLGRSNLVSEENCIEDWVVINWAWEVK